MTARDIIQKLGGIKPLSDSMGIPLTTISSWARSNRIPDWRQPKLLELAVERDIPLSTADFPTPDERVAA
jgi:hypothetical protein